MLNKKRKNILQIIDNILYLVYLDINVSFHNVSLRFLKRLKSVYLQHTRYYSKTINQVIV